jgi:predicted ATPase
LSRKLDHKFTVAYALCFSAFTSAFARDTVSVRSHAAAALELTQHEGFRLGEAYAAVFLGWSTALQGEVEDGIKWIQHGITGLTSTGMEVFRPFFLGLLAEAYRLTGDIGQSIAALDEASARAERTEELWSKAELHRMRGELLLALPGGNASGAEAEFQRAIEVARRQSARSWELRASTSLCRLWHDQGRHTEARDLLTPVHNWFAEGFATADLKDARLLLKTLGAA